MSLEIKVANLTKAATRLTDAVNEKMDEIDDKVDGAVRSVPDAIKGYSKQYYYVDAVNGNDTTGDGTSGRPFKSIRKIQDVAVNSSSIYIALKGDQTHHCVGSQLSLPLANIRIQAWGRKGIDYIDLPIIRWTPKAGEDQNSEAFLSLGTGAVSFVNIDIQPTNADNGKPVGTLSSFIMPDLSKIDVFLRESKVALSDIPFTKMYEGYDSVDIHLNQSEIVISGESSQAKMLYNRGAGELQFRLGIYNTTISGADVRDIFPFNAANSNALTNLSSL